MNSLAEVQQFVAAVRGAPTMTDVGLVLREATHRFRFDHFALAQRHHRQRAVGAIRLSDYPDAWVDRLNSRGVVHDPVLLASERQVAPFAWDHLPALLRLSPRQQAYMTEAREAGLGDGFTVPIHVPGEASGLCSFVMAGGNPLPAEALPAAQYLACFAFEAARRLTTAGNDNGDGRPRLTQRQLDCLVLAARGKSNWVAGRLLGLSEQTVHKYLEHAKRRYGVSTRTELVVRALYDGELGFSDILGSGS